MHKLSTTTDFFDLGRLPPNCIMTIYSGTSPNFKRMVKPPIYWCFSGIDWEKSPFDFQENVDILDSGSLERVMQKVPWQGLKEKSYKLCFDDCGNDYEVSGPPEELWRLIPLLQTSDVIWPCDYWIFSEETGELLEIYHEGYITYFSGQKNAMSGYKPQ